MSVRSTLTGVAPFGFIGRQAVLTRHRFSVDDYYAMAHAGILDEDSRVELLDGEVIEMAPIGSRHAVCVARLQRLFARMLDHEVAVWVQNPVRLGKFSEPEPDIALLELPLERYSTAHPEPEHVLLVVEVADATLAKDRTIKLPLYAKAAIPEVWIVDVEGRQVELYRKPSATGYAELQRVGDGALHPLAFPEDAFSLEEILGPDPTSPGED